MLKFIEPWNQWIGLWGQLNKSFLKTCDRYWCSALFTLPCRYTAQKSSIHQVTTMLATSKNALFPGHNRLPTTGIDDPGAWVIIKVSGRQYRWLWPGNRTFLEVASIVVTWWILALLRSDERANFRGGICIQEVRHCVQNYEIYELAKGSNHIGHE